MGILLQQTDTAAVCGSIAACSGNSLATLTGNRKATFGGTAGTVPFVVTLPGGIVGNVDRAAIMFQATTADFDLTGWLAGDWVVPLHCTVANSSLSIREAYVCRVNSSCTSQQTIASITGLSISLGTTGVKTITITGGSSASPAAGDTIYIVVVLRHNIGILSPPQSATFTPDQVISTPFTLTQSGTGAVTFGFTAAGVGAAVGTGSGSVSFGLTVAGVGAATAVGTGACVMGFSAEGIGAATAVGTGNIDFGFSAVGIGSSVATGTGNIAFGFDIDGVGSSVATGTGSIDFGFLTSGIGATSAMSVGVVEFGFTASGIGEASAVSRGDISFGFDVEAMSLSSTQPVTEYYYRELMAA